MASRAEYRFNRSAQKEARDNLRELIERQNASIDRDFLFTNICYRLFFLLSVIASLFISEKHTASVIPLFIVLFFTWSFKISLNSRVNRYALRSVEKYLFSERRRFSEHNSPEDELDWEKDFVDELIRARTMRPDGAAQLYLEPIGLLVAALSVVALKLAGPPISF